MLQGDCEVEDDAWRGSNYTWAQRALNSLLERGNTFIVIVASAGLSISLASASCRIPMTSAYWLIAPVKLFEAPTCSCNAWLQHVTLKAIDSGSAVWKSQNYPAVRLPFADWITTARTSSTCVANACACMLESTSRSV